MIYNARSIIEDTVGEALDTLLGADEECEAHYWVDLIDMSFDCEVHGHHPPHPMARILFTFNPMVDEEEQYLQVFAMERYYPTIVPKDKLLDDVQHVVDAWRLAQMEIHIDGIGAIEDHGFEGPLG